MSMVGGEGQGIVRLLCRLLSIALLVRAKAACSDQCAGALQQEIGGSLLQTKSKRFQQPQFKEEVVASEPNFTEQPDSVVALLAIAETVQNSTHISWSGLLGVTKGSSSTMYLVVIAIVQASFIFLVLAALGAVFSFLVLFLVMRDSKTENKLDGSAAQSNEHRGSASASSSQASFSRCVSVEEGDAPWMRRSSPCQPAGLSPLCANLGVSTPGRVTHLCPSLVVPEGKECIVVVPALPQMGREIAAVVVLDLDGKPVMQAEVAMGTTTQRPLVILRAAAAPHLVGPARQQAQQLLAYCKASALDGHNKGVLIYNAQDQLLAQLAKDPANPELGRYILQSGCMDQMYFEGDFQEHAVTVANAQLQMAAETMPATMAFHPTGVFYKLRVVSNVDVGLMICALLAIDCLETL